VKIIDQQMGLKKGSVPIYLTYNQKVQVAQFIRHIQTKHKIKFKDLRRLETINSIINNKNLQPKQKGEQLFNYLRAMCYPVLTRTERELKSLCGRIYNSTGIKVIVPQHLEGDHVTLQVNVNTYPELEQKINELKSKHGSDFQKILDFI
jgi:hypothetical protein